jgi:hypothetical protein
MKTTNFKNRKQIMRSFIITLFLLLELQQLSGQTFVNGDFENNTSSGCDYNLDDTVFNAKISNVYAFGKTNFINGYYGETDIQTTGCYVTPQSGEWCIGLSSEYITYTTSDAVAIELTSNLVADQPYELSFYLFGNTIFTDTLSKLIVGESLTDSTFGNLIDSVTPIPAIWKHAILTFTASQPSKYITVKIIPGVKAWNQIDNFSIGNATSIHESSINKSNLFPNPFSTTTTLQTAIPLHKATLLIYNSLGQIVKQINNIAVQHIIIQRDNLPCGFYYLKVTQDNKIIMKDKLVITD